MTSRTSSQHQQVSYRPISIEISAQYQPRTHTLPFTMDLERTVASFLGQPDLTGPLLGLSAHSQHRRDHNTSGCDPQPPPGVVHLPRLTC